MDIGEFGKLSKLTLYKKLSMGEEKSRKEKRKEARLAKQRERHLSWIQHQKFSKEKKVQSFSSSSAPKEPIKLTTDVSDEVRYQNSEKQTQKSKKSDPQSNKKATSPSTVKQKNKNLKRKPKTKFEEYIERETGRSAISGEEDLEMERKLAKKLKVKGGKLRGLDDGLNILFDGVSSMMDSASDDEMFEAITVSGKNKEGQTSKKKQAKKRKASVVSGMEEKVTPDVSEDEEPVNGILSDTSGEESDHELGAEVLAGASEGEGEQEVEDEILTDSSEGEAEQEVEDEILTDPSEGEAEPGVEDESQDDKSLGESEEEKEDELLPVISEGYGGSNLGVEIQADLAEPVAKVTEKKEGTVAPKSDALGKYVPPHLRSRRGSELEEHSQIRRRIRGLLNRLSESKIESITDEISTIFRSVVRSVGCQIVNEEVLASYSGQPRGNEQSAATFAAFIAGMTCLVGIDFSAQLMVSLAQSFEEQYLKEDENCMRNLTLLLSYLCIFGVCSSDLLYDFLFVLSQRMTELDVSTIMTILQCCGMKLRGDDPASMKDFVLNIQNRVNELKSSSESTTDGQPKIKNKRMEFMLETICDIKNNKRRSKEDPVQHTRIKKWLQKLRVQDVVLRGLKWSKLLDPQKKGQWWFSGDISSASNDIEEVANTIDKDAAEAQKLLQIAAAQRMNTDARRAIFCVIMSGEDYIDAFEKILRLDLSGKQDREIMRVLVECCLQEKLFNKYYSALSSKLCSHDKNHKFTLQYCLWDHFKDLESMELRRLMNLARFITEMLASYSLSLAVLKAVDLSDPTLLTPNKIMHFRMLFEFIFEKADSLVWNIFTRIAATPELEPLRTSLEFFIKHYVVSANKCTVGKFKLAKKAMANIEGILM
ncbi:hypothetical protein H6P81_004992 [Aristolochia fimbriata]|uniref:MI domain-containing protein n=1 Tax=Aristolochia fimbriata TaxID=158543 RepID=A0AAV7EXQ0_ARIFI|nr:hypothetical protein H6P81_004992 [Aristolochia fimbriata]